MPDLTDICSDFEKLYSDLFEISLPISLVSFVGSGPKDQVIYQKQGLEHFISVTLSERVVKDLEEVSPFKKLTTENIGSFFVFAEELSHLIQLACLADVNTGATRLGLESIGEVDKLIMSSALLELQTKKPHLTVIKQLLLNHCHLIDDQKVYEQSPKAILNPLFTENRSIVESSGWRREVSRFKRGLLRAS